jgi:hypothetical protein
MRKLLKKDKRRAYTLDMDATQIVAEKQSARRTYKGEIGYMPLVGHLAEAELVIGERFREGNASPAASNLEFIRYCEEQLSAGKRIGALRADSATYQAAIINDCEASGKRFAIGADLDAAVKKSVAAIPETGWPRWRDGEIAETVHCMNDTHKAFRFIVVRRACQRARRRLPLHHDCQQPRGERRGDDGLVLPTRRGQREPDQRVPDQRVKDRL